MYKQKRKQTKKGMVDGTNEHTGKVDSVALSSIYHSEGIITSQKTSQKSKECQANKITIKKN